MRNRNSVHIVRLFSNLLILTNLLWLATGFANSSETYIVKTSALQRVLKIQEGKLSTRSLTNLLTGETYTVAGGEFTLHIFVGGWANASFDPNPKTLTARDFVLKKAERFAAADTQGYQFTLQNPPTGLTAMVQYYTVPGRPEIRKRILLSNSNTYKHLLDYIEVETISIPGAAISHQGFGQPVYAANFFLGLEYPAGYNEVTEGAIHLKHYSGHALSTRPWKSHTAVLGAAPSNQVEKTFLQYIDNVKAQPTRPFLLYNSWYDIRTLTDQNCAETIDGFKKFMLQPYGLKLDAFVLDDGWDNYQSSWEIAKSQFPEGFAPLRDKLKSIDSYPGIWASPWGGYGERRQIRTQWARENGYEVSGDMLCLAGRKYGPHFLETLSRYQQQFNIRFFKLDGLLTRCNETDHGHLPGLYAQEAEIAQFIKVLKTLRKNDPSVFIDITVGTWLSPWWLMYADCVWMTGADYAYTEDLPTFSARDKAITYRDKVLHDNYLVSNYQFPFSGLMTHGIIKGRLNLLGGKEEPLRKFTDNAVIYFSRGVMMWELYITPSILSKAEWDNLAATIKWAYAHMETLKQTRFILGDPSAGEAYGYLHPGKQETLVTLRNPFLYPQQVNLPGRLLVPETASAKGPLHLQIRYPYRADLVLENPEHDSIAFVLQGNEVLALKSLPLSNNQILINHGVPYEILSRSGTEIELAFHPRQNFREISLHVPDGTKLQLSRQWRQVSRKGNWYRLQWNGEPWKATAVSRTSFGMQENVFHTALQVDIPDSSKDNQLLILVDSEEELDTLNAEARIDGETVAPSVVKDANARWWWVTVPLSPGSHAVSLSIARKDSGAFHATFHGVLESSLMYSRGPRLKLNLKEKLPIPASPLPRFRNEVRFTAPVVENFSVGKEQL